MDWAPGDYIRTTVHRPLWQDAPGTHNGVHVTAKLCRHDTALVIAATKKIKYHPTFRGQWLCVIVRGNIGWVDGSNWTL